MRGPLLPRERDPIQLVARIGDVAARPSQDRRVQPLGQSADPPIPPIQRQGQIDRYLLFQFSSLSGFRHKIRPRRTRGLRCM